MILALISLTWQIIKVDTTGSTGFFSSIAVRDLEIHIAYYDTSSHAVKYAFSSDFGSTWSYDTVQVLPPGVNLRWLNLDIDTNNLPHIVLSENQTRNLYHLFFDGTNWNIELVDGNINVGFFCDIFIDDSNYIHIAYSERTPQRALKYAVKKNGGWQIEYIDYASGNTVFSGVSIKVDTISYNVHISYWDPQNEIPKYVTGKIGNWTIINVEASGSNTGKQTSIAIDSGGRPHVSYFRYGGKRGLKYAISNGVVFDTFYLDSFTAGLNPRTGQWSVIEITPLDSVWISYYDDDITALKLLHKTSVGWDTIIVDSTGEVGRYCSMDLSLYNLPVISYYDATGEDLKLAIFLGPDNIPPGPPQNLLANGSSPSPWNNTGVFELTWTNPFDQSGIKRALYKLFSPPASNFDTTGSLKPISPDTVYINQQGIVPLYMWLEDSSGNVNYNNYSVVNLRYDAIPPQNSEVNILDKFSNSMQFTVTWTKGQDFGVIPSGIKGYNVYYKDGAGNWQLWLSDYPDTFAIFNGVDGHIYYFEAIAIDSAGNLETQYQTEEDTVIVDLTPPSIPQNLLANGFSPSPWTNNPQFLLTWEEPYDFTGINRRLYKLGSPPQNPYDTTGTFSQSPETLEIYNEGIIPLYLWLEDSAGNASHNNYATVNLRYDSTKPSGAVVNIIENFTNQTSFDVHWVKASDNVSGVMFYELHYKVKGGNWNIWRDSIIDTFTNFNAGFSDTMYYFEVVSIDSAGNIEILQGIAEDSIYIDVSAPEPPQNILANGSNPSPWTNDSTFVLTWTNPEEPNGISKALYKIGTKPTSNFDTTGSLNSLPPDTVYTKIEEGIKLYMWLVDGLGNVDFNNMDSVLLRHDHTPPSGALVQIPLYSNQDTVLVIWTQAQDQGGSGIKSYDLYYKDGTGPWTTFISDTNTLSVKFAGIDGHKYFFEALSRDSAGNIETRTMIPEDSIIFDLTPPFISSINPPDSSQNVPVNTDIIITFSEKLKSSTVVDTNFEIEGKISGLHNFVLNYDSLDFIVTLSPQTGFASQETVFVRVFNNIQDPAGNNLQGQNQFFFVTEIIPDTEGPVCLTSLNPQSPEPYNYLYINSIVSDTGTGNSMITYAEMFIDSIGLDGTGIPLDPVDGNYDENIEEVSKTIDLSSYNFKPGEIHYIFIHAKDINNIFGKYDTVQFTISPDDDTLPPIFSNFTQDTFIPGTVFYIKGTIQDPSGVYDDSTGSDGQGVYLLWDIDGELDTSFNEIQLERYRGDTFKTILELNIPDAEEMIYRVFAYDNDFDTQHPMDRKKGGSSFYKILFYSPMTVSIAYSPEIIYIGDSLKVEVTANIAFTSPPVCSLITAKGSLKEEIQIKRENETKYTGSIFTAGADIGKARIVAYYNDFGNIKRKEDTVLIQAKGEFLPNKTVYVWPNPAEYEGNFHFYINQNAKVIVEIFDIRGKKIMESSGIFKGGVKPHTLSSNAIKLNLRKLASGVYIFKLTAEALDTKKTKTVIKKFSIVR
jgi:hypothetical protein